MIPTGSERGRRWEVLSCLAVVGVLAMAVAPILLGQVSPQWDADGQFASYFGLVSDYARHGRLVTWSPWTDGGMPMFIEPQVGALSPLTLLCALVFGPTEAGFRHYWFTLWALAGVGMFLLARHLRAPRWAALALALGYALSGPMCGNAQHVSWIYANALLPWILWRWDAMLETGSLAAALQAGALWGLSALGGYPGHVVATAGFAALWALGRGLLGRRAASQASWTRFGVALGTGILVAAPLYISFALEAKGFSDRSGALPRLRVIAENALDPRALWTLLSPYPSVLQLSVHTLWPLTDPSSSSLFLGLVPLALVAFALLPGGNRRWQLALGVLALLGFAVACSAAFPLRGWLYDLLPPFRYFRHSSLFRVYTVLALCLLGVESARTLDEAGESRPPRRYGIVACALALLAPLGYAGFSHFVAHVHLQPVALLECALVPAIVLAAMRMRRHRARVGLLLAAVVLDSFCNVRLAARLMWDPSPAARARWDGLNRAHSSELSLSRFDRDPGTPDQNYNLLPKRPNLYNYTALFNHFHLGLREIPEAERMVTGSHRIWFAASAPTANVSMQTLTFLRDTLGQRHAAGFLVHPRSAMQSPLAEGTIDPAALPAGMPLADELPVRLRRYEPTALAFEAVAPTDGWLFIGDRWAASWRASVNGRPVDVLGANLVFRAVQVPRGPIHVELTYRPRFLAVPLAVSWLLLALALTPPLYHKLRPKTASSDIARITRARPDRRRAKRCRANPAMLGSNRP